MSALASENFGDKLLMPWFYLAEDLDLRGSGYEGCFYPVESIENLRQTVDQEWEIFACLRDDSELEAVWDWVRCQDCRAVGPPTYRRPANHRGGQSDAQWAHCSTCGSPEVVGVGFDPNFRLERLRAQH
jgi:hypothetical protein